MTYLLKQEDRRNEVSEFWTISLSAGISRVGFRSFSKLMDMPKSRAYPASGYFLPRSTGAIAVQSILCQAQRECLAQGIVGSNKYTEFLRAQGSGIN